jgi:hypothetical protein
MVMDGAIDKKERTGKNEGMGDAIITQQSKDSECRGWISYIVAYDLAYDMKREPLRELLGCRVEEYTIGTDKRNPRTLFFFRPQTIRLPAIEAAVFGQRVPVQRSVKLFNVGAISIEVRIPFQADRFEDLVRYHDIEMDGERLTRKIDALAEDIRAELSPHCIRPLERLREGEAYTVFCLDRTPGGDGNEDDAEDWLARNQRKVAGVLMEEDDITHLSDQESEDTIGHYISYYDRDLIVVDWDAALVIGQGDSLNDVLHIMEVGHVQMAELKEYDQILDAALEASYRDVTRRSPRARGGVRRNLREIRIDLVRLNDELMNITKFFGDWHLARVYQLLSDRLSLNDWRGVIADKLKTLGNLYDLLQQDRMNFWMMVLEATIVLLFIIDVIIILRAG